MTSEEAKQCLYSRVEVVCKGIRYKCITAIVYRLDESGKHILVSAELLDKNKNSVTIAQLKDVEEHKDNECKS